MVNRIPIGMVNRIPISKELLFNRDSAHLLILTKPPARQNLQLPQQTLHSACETIFIFKKTFLKISPLGRIMEETYCCKSSYSWHATSLYATINLSKKMVAVLIFPFRIAFRVYTKNFVFRIYAVMRCAK